jgi:hypothetical protein
MSEDIGQLVTRIAGQVLDELKAAGIPLHAIEITAWRTGREILATGIALPRVEARKTQQTTQEVTK